MKTSRVLRFFAATVFAGAFWGCESTDDAGAYYGGTAYYGVGFADPYYYGGVYYPPDVIVTPPRPDRPDRPDRPSQPIARPMPSVPSMSRGGGGRR